MDKPEKHTVAKVILIGDYLGDRGAIVVSGGMARKITVTR